MSDGSRAADAIVESVDAVTDAVDVEPDDLDVGEGTEGPVAMGRTLGARAGRELGGVLGRYVGEFVASGLREGHSPRDVAGDVRQFLVDVFSALLRDADVDAALTEIRDTILSASEGIQAATGEVTETTEEVKETTEETLSGESEADEGDVTTPEELDDLRGETLEELLELMEYEEMQSIAKKVGVKANLDTETMQERIVEEFTDGVAESSTDGSES